MAIGYHIKKHTLQFKQASGTSRGILTSKNSWIIELFDPDFPACRGLGEASIIENLSPEWSSDFEQHIQTICDHLPLHIASNFESLQTFPSIRFALESALLDLKNSGHQHYFPSRFSEGKSDIPINGLIWMGSKEFMWSQIEEKIEAGFNCIKLKIGALDFETEIEILKNIRQRFSKDTIELRLDANGAFATNEALHKLEQLARFSIHSIEQPIRQGQLESMEMICRQSPIPIALDEELIGIYESEQKRQLLSFIKPHFIILKPSLVGGFASSDAWISEAYKLGIDWWITSALESNIGLNAIAQYTFTKNNPLPQGLGTGLLFTNNFPSPLYIEHGKLRFDPAVKVQVN